jgi:hypothetical protein
VRVPVALLEGDVDDRGLHALSLGRGGRGVRSTAR